LKSAILSSVSHELRTPLSTIKAAASSLRGREVDWDSPARSELIAAIDDEADHLNLLVGNLLDMSRIESGALKPKREWNILSEIVGSVLARMKYLAGDHQIKVDVPENLPLVPVDYVEMEQVFTNLISNSVKHWQGVVMIWITVDSAMENGRKYYEVSVADNGPGIPDDLKGLLFQRFKTGDPMATGHGLGLYLVKTIVEDFGGRVRVEDRVPGDHTKGAKFVVMLPAIE